MAGRRKKPASAAKGEWAVVSPPVPAPPRVPAPLADKNIRLLSRVLASRTPQDMGQRLRPKICHRSGENPWRRPNWETARNRRPRSRPNGLAESSSSWLLHPASDYERAVLPEIFCLNLRWSSGAVDRLDSGVEVDQDLARFGAFTG